MNRREFLRLLSGLVPTLLFAKLATRKIEFNGKSDYLGKANQNDPELFNGHCVTFYIEGKAVSDWELYRLYLQNKTVF